MKHLALALALLCAASEPICAQPDGSRIPTFGSAGVGFMNVSTVMSVIGRSDQAEAILQQPDGRIIVGGWYRSAGGGDGWDWALGGFTASGAVDSTFGIDGRVKVAPGAGAENSRSYAIANDAAQRIYQSGTGRVNSTAPSSWALLRYLPNGIVDSTFGVEGRVLETELGSSRSTAVRVQGNGRIATAGNIFADFPAVICYLESGARDAGFTSDSLPGVASLPVQGEFHAMVVDPQTGAIVAAGESGGAVLVARFNADGSLDDTFSGDGWAVIDADSTTSSLSNAAHAVAIDAFGRVVLAGRMRNQDRMLVMRLRSDGALDNGFGQAGIVALTPGGADSEASDLLVQTDCRIVVSGFNIDPERPLLLRLLPSGELDSTFAVNGISVESLPDSVAASTNGTWSALTLSIDGELLVAGKGYQENSLFPDFCVAKYGTSLDESVDCLDPTAGINGPGLRAIVDAVDISPNPAVSTCLLTSTGSAPMILMLLRDGLGRVAQQRTFNPSVQLHLDVATLNPGTYFVEVGFADGARAVERVVKQ